MTMQSYFDRTSRVLAYQFRMPTKDETPAGGHDARWPLILWIDYHGRGVEPMLATPRGVASVEDGQWVVITKSGVGVWSDQEFRQLHEACPDGAVDTRQGSAAAPLRRITQPRDGESLETYLERVVASYEHVHTVLVATKRELGNVMNEARRALDAVYFERTHLVALLAEIINQRRQTGVDCSAWVGPHEGPNWGAEWKHVVYVRIGKHQLSWHVPQGQMPMFWFLSHRGDAWDGHTVGEKYRRIRAAIGVGDHVLSPSDLALFELKQAANEALATPDEDSRNNIADREDDSGRYLEPMDIRTIVSWRAILDDLVAKLPRCTYCGSPATRAHDRGGERYCDDHGQGVPDYPRAIALRRAVTMLNTADAAFGKVRRV